MFPFTPSIPSILLKTIYDKPMINLFMYVGEGVREGVDVDGPLAATRNETGHMGTVERRGMYGVCVWCMCECVCVRVYGSKA